MPLHLPVDDALPELIEALRNRRSAVLIAPPGSGKTTRAPAALLDAGIAGSGKVLVLQPRRVAARLVAARIAHERGARIGGEIGYSVRFERKTGPTTRLEVLTEGLLTRRLQADPFLDGVGLVVLDEFHERSMHADLALSLLAEVQREARDDLRLLVMSATLDPAPVVEFLGGEGACSVVRAQGRAYPVTIQYTPGHADRPMHAQVASAILGELGEGGEGHILAFLPGVGEIERVAGALKGVLPPGVALHRLHGRVPPAAQDAALAPSAQRKVVLSTNIAETSVTLPGVRAVVDSGLVRRPHMVPTLGLERLETVDSSRASVDQRAGRAGRTGPGRAVRLWSEHAQMLRPAQDLADVVRLDLAPAVLQILAWGAHPETFGWFERPPASALSRAMALLRQLGALDGRGLSAIGQQLAGLPLHPRMGRVVVAAREGGGVELAAGAAALAGEADPWAGRESWLAARGLSDLMARVALIDAPRDSQPHRGRLARVRQARAQLLRSVGRGRSGGGEDAALRALLAGFPDRVGRRRAAGAPRFLLASGIGAELGPGVSVQGAEWIVAIGLTAGRHGREATIRLAAQISAEWLPLEPTPVLAFDRNTGAVEHTVEHRFGALVVHSRRASTPADPGQVAQLLSREARSRDLPRPCDAAAMFLARVSLVRTAMPELELPPLDLDQLGEQICFGLRTIAAVQRVDLAAFLRAQLTWKQRQLVDTHAPERMPLPHGRSAAVVYAHGQAPVLAARIQELFGVTATPRIAGRRVPLQVHLLAPNRRPAQITGDLESFWREGYPVVRKELRGRYPKHRWPEDPLGPEALAPPRRRRR